MRYFLKNPNRSFYVSLAVCGVAVFILLPNEAVAGKTINNPPLKVFIPNVNDDSTSGKLLSFGANHLDYYPEKAEVSATGSIDIEDEQRIILADNLNYEQKTGALNASGNVVVLEPNGQVRFVDELEIKEKTKDLVVGKIKIKLESNPEFAANEEAANSTEKSTKNSEEPSLFSQLISGISDALPTNDNAFALAQLEPAAGGDSPIPQPDDNSKLEAGSVPIISLPTTTDLPDPKKLAPNYKTETKEPVPVPPVVTQPTASPPPPAKVSTIPLLQTKIEPVAKSAPTVAVEVALLPKIEKPKMMAKEEQNPAAPDPQPVQSPSTAPSVATTPIPPVVTAPVTAPKPADIIPDVKQIISSDSAETKISDGAKPADSDAAPPSPTVTDSIKKSPVKEKKKKIAKKPKVVLESKPVKKQEKPAVAENSEKPQNAEPEEVLSEDSRKLLNEIAPKFKSIKAKSAPKPIDVDHQHDMGLGLQAAGTVDNSPPNPALGVTVEKKPRKINVDYELEKAYDSMNSGQSQAAIETYKNILANSPNNTQALFGLATLYHRARQLDKARPLYAKLLAIDPKNRDGFNNFLVLLADEAPHEALSELEKLETKNPAFSIIPAQMAVIYQKLGDMDKATEKMFRAVSLAPENLTYRYNLAIMMDRQKNYDEAEKLYKQLIEAADRGEKIPGNVENLQQRLTFISSNR